MKQTAVEWLGNEITNRITRRNPHDTIIIQTQGEILIEIIEQAKEMEKEKLEQFYNHGQWAVIENGHGECFEDYYNRTFKSE